jgi:hypothetical protein
MTALQLPETVKTAIAKEPSVFFEILREAVSLAVWERGPVRQITPFLSYLLEGPDPVNIDVTPFQADDFSSSLENYIVRSPDRVVSAAHAFVSDVASLVACFGEVSGRKHLRVRLQRVEDDGCALFHVDTLALRMLCTYCGPGTQWLDDENVRREELGLRGRSIEDANRSIVINDQRIHTIPAWNVLIFKGRLWEGHGYQDGLVHRSAPVRSMNERRLRLTVDFSNACAC